MEETIATFFDKMLVFFPRLIEEYDKHIEKYSERLDTVVIEDVFMPQIISLLEKSEDNGFLNELFDYFEVVSNNADADLLNIFSVTVLEILGNDIGILKKAKKFMGPRTTELQIEADRDLGRVKESRAFMSLSPGVNSTKVVKKIKKKKKKGDN